MNEFTMPHSRAAEEALLGSLVIDSEHLGRIVVQPEDFYITKNGMIYAAMQDLRRRGQSVDYITICTNLDARGQLAEVGGPAEITRLINATPTDLGAESYANIILQRARRREIIRAAQALTGAAFDMDSDLSAAVGSALDALARTVITEKGAVHIQKYLGNVFNEIEDAIANPREIYGIPTGFADIDRITFGLQRGEKLVLSGDPGVGKSVLAAQWLINAAQAGHAGALYELEMSGNQVIRRALAARAKDAGMNVTTQKMRQGKMDERELAVFAKSVEVMERLPIYLSDASEITTAEIRADLMRLVDKYGVELVVIDYEGLLGDNPEKEENARTKLISKRLHDIAKDLNLAVVAIGDMTKEGIKGSVKGQAAIAGTARSLHDADQIVVIRKTEQANVVRLTWEKMREGEGDRFVDLVRVPGFPMFKSIERRQL